MPEAGTVEHDDPIVLGCKIDQATRLEILDHAAIAMEQNQRASGPALDIVQPNTVDVDEPPLGRIITLRLVGKAPIDERGRCEQAGRRGNRGGQGMFCESMKGRGRQRWRTFFQYAHVTLSLTAASCWRV
ncbi:hypothetical protein ACVWZR_009845 [Bradyrhizobium sp. i1.3.1]